MPRGSWNGLIGLALHGKDNAIKPDTERFARPPGNGGETVHSDLTMDGLAWVLLKRVDRLSKQSWFESNTGRRTISR